MNHLWLRYYNFLEQSYLQWVIHTAEEEHHRLHHTRFGGNTVQSFMFWTQTQQPHSETCAFDDRIWQCQTDLYSMHFYPLLTLLALPHPLQTCVGGLSCHSISKGSLGSWKSEHNSIEASQSVSAHGWFDTTRLLCWRQLELSKLMNFFWLAEPLSSGLLTFARGSLTESKTNIWRDV